MLLKLAAEGCFSAIAALFNPALNLAPFGRWTPQKRGAPLIPAQRAKDVL